MSTSFTPKTRLARIKNSQRNVTGAAGQSIGIRIDRDSGLIEEISLIVTAQANIATNPPTGCDVRQFIERVNLRSNIGDLVKSVSGQELYDFMRLNENTIAPITAYGAGGGALASVVYSLNLQMLMKDAYYDLVSAVKGGETSKLDIEVIPTSAAKAAAVGFTGYTGAMSNFQLTVDVELWVRPDMATAPHVGVQDHYLTSREDSSTTAGTKTLELDPSNKTRHICIHVDDMTTANTPVPSDAIVGTVKVTQGGKLIADTDFTTLRLNTQRENNLNIKGFAVIDFGDQNQAWPELTSSPVQVQYQILSGSPSYRVQVTQDYVKNRADNHARAQG